MTNYLITVGISNGRFFFLLLVTLPITILAYAYVSKPSKDYWLDCFLVWLAALSAFLHSIQWVWSESRYLFSSENYQLSTFHYPSFVVLALIWVSLAKSFNKMVENRRRLMPESIN